MQQRIRPLGSYFPQDEQGYVCNPCDAAHLAGDWEPLLAEVVAVYQRRLPDRLHSVWVRGSLPRGLATAGISDVDTFALVAGRAFLPWRTPAWGPEEAARLQRRFPLAGEVELVLSSYHDELECRHPRLAMLIATQSLPLMGPDIRPALGRFRPGPDMLLHYRWLAADLEAFAGQPSYRRQDCRQLAKQLLRVAGELVQERDGRFTPDLYWCYVSFTRYYPEQAPAFREVFHFFLNPVAGDPVTRSKLLQNGRWLLSEVRLRLPVE